MADSKGAAVIEESVDPARAPLREAKQRFRPRLPPFDIWMGLEVSRVVDDDLCRVRHLEANREHVVMMRFSRNRSAFPEADLVVRMTVAGEYLWVGLSCDSPEIELQAVEPDGVTDRRFVRVERSSLDDELEVAFHVWVPPDCVETPCTFQVLKGPEAAPSACRETLTLPVTGGRPALSEAGYERIGLVVDTRVPDNVALLHVSQRAENQLYLKWYHRSVEREAEAQIDGSLSLATRLSRKILGERQTRHQSIATLMDEVKEFSRGQRQLNEWFEALLSSGTEEPLLIVNDQSACEVPWEMFELKNSQLGAETEVVRWARVSGGRRRLDLVRRTVRGHVAKLLQCTPQNTRPEELELQKLSAEPLASMDDVVTCLNREPAQGAVGLVYIASHGEYARAGSSKAKEGYAFKRERELEAGEGENGEAAFHFFYERALERLLEREERSAIVIANACQSGRLRQAKGNVSGPAERCLGRTALGYVGTLSDVVSDLASQLGAEILATLSKAQGERRLSRILRDIRARASQQLRAAGTNEEQLLRLVHAYNYVYFGEPYVELEVGPNESTRGQSSIQ